MEPLLLSLLSGLVGALISASLAIWIKERIDRGKLIEYLHSEVKENINIYDFNQELLKDFVGGRYTGPKHIVLPFHYSAWETLKAKGYLHRLKRELRDSLENLYLEIKYENQLILNPSYLTSGAEAVDLRDRMSVILPELLETAEQELKKKVDP